MQMSYVCTVQYIVAISHAQILRSWNIANASEELNVLLNLNSHIRLVQIVLKRVVNIRHMEAKYLRSPTLHEK